MAGVRGRHAPLVMRLVEMYVNEQVVGALVNPVYANGYE